MKKSKHSNLYELRKAKQRLRCKREEFEDALLEYAQKHPEMFGGARPENLLSGGLPFPEFPQIPRDEVVLTGEQQIQLQAICTKDLEVTFKIESIESILKSYSI